MLGFIHKVACMLECECWISARKMRRKADLLVCAGSGGGFGSRLFGRRGDAEAHEEEAEAFAEGIDETHSVAFPETFTLLIFGSRWGGGWADRGLGGRGWRAVEKVEDGRWHGLAGIREKDADLP